MVTIILTSPCRLPSARAGLPLASIPRDLHGDNPWIVMAALAASRTGTKVIVRRNIMRAPTMVCWSVGG